MGMMKASSSVMAPPPSWVLTADASRRPPAELVPVAVNTLENSRFRTVCALRLIRAAEVVSGRVEPALARSRLRLVVP